MKGFILFSVLIFLQIFTLLALYGLTAVNFLLKEANERQRYHRHHHHAMLALKDLELRILFKIPLCRIPLTFPTVLANYDKQWWKMHACHGRFGKNQYDYVVELLDEEACALVQKHDTYRKVSVEYYRISLLYLAEDFKKVKIVLQSIIAKKSNETKPCFAKWSVVNLGCQMRRQLLGRKTLEGYYPIIHT